MSAVLTAGTGAQAGSSQAWIVNRKETENLPHRLKRGTFNVW